MRNRRMTAVGLVLVLSLASMSFKCGGDNSNGNADPQRGAIRAADAIAKSIGEMNNVKRELGQQGKIAPAEELKLTQMLLRLNTADRALLNRLKAMRSTPSEADKTQLVSMFNELTTALDDLNSNGVLGVGNEDARNRLATIIAAIRASVQIIQSFAQA
jgi:hypothetical protein